MTFREGLRRLVHVKVAPCCQEVIAGQAGGSILPEQISESAPAQTPESVPPAPPH